MQRSSKPRLGHAELAASVERTYPRQIADVSPAAELTSPWPSWRPGQVCFREGMREICTPDHSQYWPHGTLHSFLRHFSIQPSNQARLQQQSWRRVEGQPFPQVLAFMSGLQSQAGCAGCGGSSSSDKISLASHCGTFLSSATPVQQPDVGALSVQVSSGLAWFR